MLASESGRQTEIGTRNAAIVALLYDSGLRAAELCRLQIPHLYLDTHELHVQIKGGAVLPGWFGDRSAGFLRQWLALRWARPGVENVFVAVGGKSPGLALTPRGLGAVVREIGRQAGLHDVTPHSFRRGFAVALSAAGIPDNILKDLGRWTDTNMIKRYTLAQRVAPLYRSPLDHNRDISI